MLDGNLDSRAGRLNDRYRHHAATEVLRRAVTDPDLGRVALVSSFGAESVVLLHMVSVVAPGLPVLFIDTQMLFPETLAYQREVASKLGLTNVQVITRPPVVDVTPADKTVPPAKAQGVNYVPPLLLATVRTDRPRVPVVPRPLADTPD